VQSRVSVVTSVYNGESYFDRALPSILSQKLEDFEWVIVDDGSTDRTYPLLLAAARQDPRIQVFSQGRLGRSKALNFAISKAQGQYIANQDFDDISAPDRLKCQVNYLDTHPEVCLVGSDFLVKDENRNECYERILPVEHDQIIRMMAKCVPFAHTLVTFRKDAWLQAGGYPELDDIEDLRLWISMVKNGWKLGNVSKVLGTHHYHPKSFWHRNFKYSDRQKKLAQVQWQAVHELDLPVWMAVYPMLRSVYRFAPDHMKAVIRRATGQMTERKPSTEGRY
jgi:glycosyltransferase EpsE